MKKLFLTSILFTVNYLAADELTFFNIENSALDEEETQSCLSIIQENNPNVIFSFDCDPTLVENFHRFYLGNNYPYYYKRNQNLIIISQFPLDYIEENYIDSRNLLVAFVCDRNPNFYYVGHLPSLNEQEIELVKSYLIASNPYTRIVISGDLSPNLFQSIPALFDLCAKGRVSAEATVNEKGEGKTEVKAKIESTDGKHKIEASGKFEQDNLTPNKPKTEAKVKYEYSFEF